jgi:ubiquinone/menaquinone biosynthesis C-methylase UbiE
VIAVDRSAARLASAAARVAQSGLPNVRLRQVEMDDSNLAQEIAKAGGADLVTIVRVLQFIARPSDVIATAARFLRPSGHLIVADHVPHKDESLREQGHVWLGFEPDKLRAWLSDAAPAWRFCAASSIDPWKTHRKPVTRSHSRRSFHGYPQ